MKVIREDVIAMSEHELQAAVDGQPNWFKNQDSDCNMVDGLNERQRHARLLEALKRQVESLEYAQRATAKFDPTDVPAGLTIEQYAEGLDDLQRDSLNQLEEVLFPSKARIRAESVEKWTHEILNFRFDHVFEWQGARKIASVVAAMEPEDQEGFREQVMDGCPSRLKLGKKYEKLHEFLMAGAISVLSGVIAPVWVAELLEEGEAE